MVFLPQRVRPRQRSRCKCWSGDFDSDRSRLGCMPEICLEARFLPCHHVSSFDPRWMSISFLWGFFKWFFSGRACSICKVSGVSCGGFAGFPTFGLQALAWKWVRSATASCMALRVSLLPNVSLIPQNFDFAVNLVGTGMICSVSALIYTI